MHRSQSPTAAFNQTPPLGDYNLFASDVALQAAVERETRATLHAAGSELGRAELAEQGRLANRHGPVLHTLDPRGVRIDHVEFHPAWNVLMRWCKPSTMRVTAASSVRA